MILPRYDEPVSHFKDREEAARRLADRLRSYRGTRPLVLGVPRGGIVVARTLARSLEGELDVVLVRKLRAPEQPEFAIGSITESGAIFLSREASRIASREYIDREATEALELIRKRREEYTPHRPPADPRGRTVIVVDDGIATGATMRAALASVREARPKRLIAAAAVAPRATVENLEELADEVVCLHTPEDFRGVSQFFEDFSQVSDEEARAILREGASSPEAAVKIETPRGPVRIRMDGVTLEGDLEIPEGAGGLVLFAHGSGSSRLSPRNAHVAGRLRESGLGTFLVDLLSEAEDRDAARRFEIEVLTDRLVALTEWIRKTAPSGLRLGYFGASTGAAAALRAAARLKGTIGAVVSRGGRPDLALEALPDVHAPTLLIVGGDDEPVTTWNREAFERLGGEKRLEIIPGATHLFEEPGALDEVARLAAEWFQLHLVSNPRERSDP